MLKKFVAYIISWALYYMGDAISHIMNLMDSLGNLYPLYNKIMCMSVDVQDWGGNATPWEKINEIEGEEE